MSLSPENKNDPSTKVDTLLASLGAVPAREDHAWEASAEAIVKAAQSAPRASEETLAALFAAPTLSPEPGEATRTNEAPTRPTASAGEKSMSQDSNSGSSAKPESAPMSGLTSGPMSAATSKRPSLKELAARASQAGAATKQSVPPGALSAPVVGKPLSEAPPAPAEKPARTSTPSVAPTAPSPVAAKGSDSGKSKEDSGIVDLNAINKAATAKQIADAEKAKPATHDLGDEGEGEKNAVAASDNKVKSLAEAREKKKGGGATWGIVVAVVGIAAAAAIMLKGKPPAPSPTANVGQDKPAVEAPAQPEAPKLAEAPKPTSTALSLDSLPSEPADAPKSAVGGDPGKLAAAPQATGTTPEPAPAATPANGAAPVPTPGKVGDLNSAMAQAVGGAGDKGSDGTEEAVPAAGGKSGGNQNIPEQPSQGSVASAIGAVMGGAKACVAGADDVSRAQVTFSSSGAVSNVSVTGWAAAHGKSGCVQAALKGAKTGPFSKPSFTVGTTIRP